MEFFNSSDSEKKLNLIKYTHFIVFSALTFLNLIPFWRNFTFEWRGIESVVNSSWFSFFYQINLLNIFHLPLIYAIIFLFNFLLPLEASVLLVLIAFRTERTKISPYAYLLIGSAYVIRLITIITYALLDTFSPLATAFIFTIIGMLAAALPAFLFGLKDENVIVEFKEEYENKWMKVALFPLTIVKKTMELAASKGESKVLRSIIILLGTSLAAKVSIFIYQLMLLSIIIPVGAFIVFWLVIVAIAIYIGYKLLTLNSDKETVVTKERSSFLRGKYLSHEVDGEEVARTYHHDGILHDYDETVDNDGNVIAKSEKRSGILKGDYVEHRDKDGNVIATSREKDTLLGKVTEHSDKDGKVIGTSRKQAGIIEDYTETTKK